MVHQLAALYNPAEKLHQTTFKHTRLTVAYRALADLLQLLITLDGVVLANDALLSAWTDYKRMMQYVRTKPVEFGLDGTGAGGGAASGALGTVADGGDEDDGDDAAAAAGRRAKPTKLEKFERLLVHLDKTVMCGATFRGCIEQDFEDVYLAGSEVDGAHGADNDAATVTTSGGANASPMTAAVRSNATLLAELLGATRQLWERAAAVLSTPSETSERKQLVGIYGLYAFYRRLTPPNLEPDAKLYAKLWTLQRRLPVVTLYGRLTWFVADFLLEHAPPPTTALKKLDPPRAELESTRRATAERLDAKFGDQVDAMRMQVGREDNVSHRSEEPPFTTTSHRRRVASYGVVWHCRPSRGWCSSTPSSRRARGTTARARTRCSRRAARCCSRASCSPTGSRR